MPTEPVPTQSTQYVSLGTISTSAISDSNPVLLLKINGVPYSNGYREILSNDSYRNFFPVYISSTGEVRLYCHTVVYGSVTAPAETLYNIEVFVAE